MLWSIDQQSKNKKLLQKTITKNDKVTATKNDLEVIYKYIKENPPQANITSRITSPTPATDNQFKK